MTPLPTLTDLDALGILLSQQVPPEFEDFNGHVNVRHHYGLHMQAMEVAFVDVFGIGPQTIAETGHSSFSLAHHLQFHREILIGQEVSVHLRLLGRSAKVIHAQSILANRTTGETASTMEYVEAYVDLATRKTAVIPPDLAEPMDALLSAQQELPWSLPASHALGVKRPSPMPKAPVTEG